MDHFGADFSVLFVAACECFAVMWVYGKVIILVQYIQKLPALQEISLDIMNESAIVHN
jgi:hypothetical protein